MRARRRGVSGLFVDVATLAPPMACGRGTAGRPERVAQGQSGRAQLSFQPSDRQIFKKMAPRAGLEPATIRLTVECSTN